jgi:Flp pilus assembly protein TadD
MNSLAVRRPQPKPRSKGPSLRPLEIVAVEGLRSKDAPVYSEAELMALAELGYHYLRSGGLAIARVLFEGLCSADPKEAYFRLALGLSCDYAGDKEGARCSYREAAQLDHAEPRAELNLAELALESGDLRNARLHLLAARRRAEKSPDRALLRKANAMLSLVGEKERS